MDKSPDAFRTISEVADDLDIPQHVLRFWETRFTQIKPMKRSGGRRYYRPDDVDLLRGIRRLLYGEGYTIRGVQRILKEHGIKVGAAAGRWNCGRPPSARSRRRSRTRCASPGDDERATRARGRSRTRTTTSSGRVHRRASISRACARLRRSRRGGPIRQLGPTTARCRGAPRASRRKVDSARLKARWTI